MPTAIFLLSALSIALGLAAWEYRRKLLAVEEKLERERKEGDEYLHRLVREGAEVADERDRLREESVLLANRLRAEQQGNELLRNRVGELEKQEADRIAADAGRKKQQPHRYRTGTEARRAAETRLAKG